MKALSLFSGIGGFDLALKRAGVEIVGACEIDEYARQIYARHFPGVTIHRDATTIDPSKLPDFDILVGGFPCQAFSIAGKRRGFEDTRGTLFFEIARIAQQKRPRYLLLENVKGLLSHERGETIRIIFQTLDELGYDTQARIVNSKDFVPQNRERIFIIGHLREESRPKVFPFGEPYNANNGKKQDGQERKTVTCIDANYYKGIDNHGARTAVLHQVGNIDTKGHNSLWGRVYDPKGIAATLNAQGGGLGAKTGLYAVSSSGRSWGRESRVKLDEANTLTTGDGCSAQSSATFVYMSNKNANMKQREQNKTESWTLQTSGSDFGIKDGTRIRKLTPLECERLQGFPDGWTEGLSDTQRYKCCGNAVTVPVVEYLISSLLTK